MKGVNSMDKICKYIDKELGELENKVAMGGKLSRADIEDGKNMAKFKTAILTNKAMEEEGYSGDWDEPMHRMSNARGRSNVRRDSMGRYSREDGYSRAESDFRERLEDAIDSAPDEHKRKKLERILNEM
jgi:hypothetical protein